MKYAEYQIERKRLLAEADEQRRQAEDRDEDIQALDRLWQNVWKHQTFEGDGSANGGLRLPDVVRKFVDDATGRFTTLDIEGFVKASHPDLVPAQRTAYSKPLRPLVKQGVIEIVKRSAGTKPTVYRKAQGGAP